MEVCPFYIDFYKDSISWHMKDFEISHNHPQDETILPNEIIFDLDNYVTSKSRKVTVV